MSLEQINLGQTGSLKEKLSNFWNLLKKVKTGKQCGLGNGETGGLRYGLKR